MANPLCEQCNLRPVNRIGEKFCSRRCYWDSRKGQPPDIPEPVLREARKAGVEAARRVLLGTHQSADHQRLRFESVARTLASTERICPRCGEKFLRTHAVQKFCSGRCWKAADRAKRPRVPKFKIPIKQYRELFASQGGLCAICGQPHRFKLAVDHCHATNRVRGLLCHRCNTAIGLLKDDVSLLQRASAYLAR